MFEERGFTTRFKPTVPNLTCEDGEHEEFLLSSVNCASHLRLNRIFTRETDEIG